MAEWKAPKIWRPDTIVFIIGGGASLKDENLSLISSNKSNKRVIGVNDAFKLGEWVDVCYFGDVRWFDWNKDELIKFGGLKVCCCPRLSHHNSNVEWVYSLKRGKPLGIDLRPDYISWSKSSGASAINLAVHLGAKKIVLLGFDMSVDGVGEHNWHDYHKVKNTLAAVPYPRFLEAFPIIAKDCKREGVVVINSTMCSEITNFTKIPLEEVIRNEGSCFRATE